MRDERFDGPEIAIFPEQETGSGEGSAPASCERTDRLSIDEE